MAVTRDEVAITADLGLSAGVLDHGESRVIRNLLRLSQVRVHDIMTPRPVMFTLHQDRTVGQVMDQYARLRFTRIPIHAGDNDHITGFVTRHKVLHAHGEDLDDVPLRDLADSLESVPEDTNVAELLDRMVQRQEHLLLVKDEFEGTAGVVTLEDCIETLLGRRDRRRNRQRRRHARGRPNDSWNGAEKSMRPQHKGPSTPLTDLSASAPRLAI